MEDVIIDLLNSNLRVIIPDFGAFIVRQKNPRLIVFNEFLRFNDGLLINHIVKSEGIDPDVATQRVTDFVEDLNKILDAGKPFSLKDLGTIAKDASGKISFIQASDKSKPDMPAGRKKTAMIELDEPVAKKHQKESTQKEVVKTVSKNEPVKKETDTGNKSQDATSDSQDLPIDPVPPKNKQTVAVEKSTEKAPEPLKITERPKEAVKNTIQPGTRISVPESVDAPVDNGQKKSSRSRKAEIIIFILLFVVANGLIISYFVFGKGKSYREEEKQAVADNIVNQAPEPVDLADIDTMEILKDVVPEAVESLEPESVSDSDRYYIVAGCFRDEGNADELVRELKNKGYNAEKFGKIGNLHAVSFASFSDKEKAMTELRNIRTDVSIDAWMTRF